MPMPLTSSSRRRLLLASAASLAAPAWLTPALSQTPLRPTPSQTEGPFYPLDLPDDNDFDLLRNGTVDYRQGEPAWVEGVVTDTRGTPVGGAVVEIWQCDHAGRYHHPGDGNRADPAFQGFGSAKVGRDGRYRFRTIRPVQYGGRTPHIHVKVKLDQKTLLTTQLYVAGDPGNERDFLWRRLDEAGRKALTVPFARGSDGVRAEFPIVVN